MAQRTCSIDGCEGKHLARSLCVIHYQRQRTTGTTSLPLKMKDGPCSIDGCDKPAEKRTWCAAHYRRWRTTGSVQADTPVRPRRYLVVDGRKRCRVCLTWLPVDSFAGCRTICRDCVRVENAIYREANPDYWSDWAKSHPDNVSAAVHSRRALINGGEYETVNRSVVFERDGFACQLCGDPLDMTAAYPHPMFPTIDHIVPLSRGGDHVYSNIQAAHFRCNVAKGNRLPEKVAS